MSSPSTISTTIQRQLLDAARMRYQCRRGTKRQEDTPVTLAFRDSNGNIHAETSWFGSNMISVRASQRAITSYNATYGHAPVMTDVLFISEQPITAADLLPIAYHGTEKTVLHTPMGQKPLLPLVQHYPTQDIVSPPAPSYTLAAIGNTYSWQREDTWALPFPDPTMLTPAHALLADLWDAYGQPTVENPWPVDNISITPQQPLNPPCPLSGRDLQALRRFFPPELVVKISNEETTLGTLLPGAYESTSTVFRDASQTLWQTMNVEKIANHVGSKDTFSALEAEAYKTLHTNTYGQRRAAAFLTTKGRIISHTNVMLEETKGMPSCAETFALQQLEPGEKITTGLLLIEEEDGTLQSAAKASPCGFCRSHIVSNAADGATIITKDANDTYHAAEATRLLTSLSDPLPSLHKATQPTAKTANIFLSIARDLAYAKRAPVMVAETIEGDIILNSSLANHHADSRYPPGLAQRAILSEHSLSKVLLYTPHASQNGYISPYLREVLPTVVPNPEVCPVFLAHGETITETTVGALCPTIQPFSENNYCIAAELTR